MAITEEQVFSAAEEIRASGRFPSAISVREITGTGSLGTIQRHLRKWRHRETVSAASHNPPPEVVLETLKAFGDSFWRLALQHSDKAALQKVRLARDEQEEAHRDMEEALENLEAQHQENERLAKRIEEQLAKEHALNGELELQKDIVHKASLQCHKLEESFKSLDERYRALKTSDDHQRQMILKLNQDAEKLQVLLKDCESAKREIQQKFHDQEEDSKNAKREFQLKLHELEKVIQGERQLSDVRRRETEKKDAQLIELQAHLGQTRKELDTRQQDIERERHEVRTLQMELKENQIKLESTRIINQRLESLLEQLTPRNKNEGR